MKDMSIFLAPLIDELNELWKVIDVIDNSRKRNKLAHIKGILLWDGDETLQAWTLIHIEDICKVSSLSDSLFGFKRHTLLIFDYVGPIGQNC